MEKKILPLQVLQRFVQNVKSLLLDKLGRNPILPINKLQNRPGRISDRPVITDHHILHSLDQPSLNIPRLGRLDSRVDQPLSTPHSMEKKFLRGKTLIITVGHETPALGTKIIFEKMRQGTTVETEGNSLALNILLPDQTRDLGDVNIVAFGPGNNHVFYMVFYPDMLVQKLANLRPTVVKDHVDLVLEGLDNCLAGLVDDQFFVVPLGVL